MSERSTIVRESIAQVALERQAGIRPSDQHIVSVLADHYHVHELVIVQWIIGMDMSALEAEFSKEFAP